MADATLFYIEPVRDSEANQLTRDVPPLDGRDLRYLRKALRHRFHQAGVDEFGGRAYPPSRYVTGGYLRVGRARQLDRLADWIVQAEA